NGAEINRVEETMEKICTHYGIRTGEFFVLSNGIFTTMGSRREEVFAKVQHIPVSGAHLNKVAAVNQLSREIEAGIHTLDDLDRCLDEIERMPGKRKIVQILASAVGSGAFCYLFGGDLGDCAAAFISGFILYIYILNFSKNRSKIVSNILGGALVTFLCMIMYHLKFGHHISSMIIGSVIPMIPGVAFTNAIRDIADGDYISGSVRMLDAMLSFLSIALGVGLMFTMYQRVTGGILL
ncbi:MAG: threonine/serine exporter family protein, partial [Lachnospiraceae bacterium]|nr:threonine/serine exporter family protein [Lachnospiraceae bacterium]